MIREEKVSLTKSRMNLLIFRPKEYAHLPLLIYLHGAGERGTKIDHLTRHGVPLLIANGREIPAVVLCPQCPGDFIWNNITPELYQVITDVMREYYIDRDRVVITGSSMGGYGTWETAICFPELFAAAAPVSGGGVTFRAAKLANVPVRAYHGDRDDAVEYENSVLMVNAVNRQGGAAELVTLAGMGHNDAINYAYRETDLIEWLLSQRKTDFSPVVEPYSQYY